MSNTSFNLTRDDLRQIVGSNDPRKIRAFEKLFSNSKSVENDSENVANLGVSKANQANARAIRNEERAKGNSVLLWLSTV